MSVFEKCEKTFRNQFDPTGSKSVLRSQRVTDELILSVTQRAAADERNMAWNFPKRSLRKINRVVRNPAGYSDYWDPDKSKCGQTEDVGAKVVLSRT